MCCTVDRVTTEAAADVVQVRKHRLCVILLQAFLDYHVGRDRKR
jgi:hypothetical protein